MGPLVPLAIVAVSALFGVGCSSKKSDPKHETEVIAKQKPQVNRVRSQARRETRREKLAKAYIERKRQEDQDRSMESHYANVHAACETILRESGRRSHQIINQCRYWSRLSMQDLFEKSHQEEYAQFWEHAAAVAGLLKAVEGRPSGSTPDGMAMAKRMDEVERAAFAAAQAKDRPKLESKLQKIEDWLPIQERFTGLKIYLMEVLQQS